MYIGDIKKVKKEVVTVNGALGAEIQWLLSEKEDIPHFFMRYATIAPGGFIPLHSHEVIHEMYIVKGTGSVLIESGEISIEAGNFIYMPSNIIHGTKNTGNEPLEFICCINKL
jgi:quercetin dioxygenase-like cupin family protein